MTPERWQEIKSLFLRVREEPPATQVAILDEACAEDPALRSEVEALLASREAAETFLETPAIEVAAISSEGSAFCSVEGRRIGSYTLIREIASGGMGTVYEARQDQPSRVVALKVMKLGITSRSAQQRFQYESEVLARLSHPGIAHIHEAGTHTEGRTRIPFFAMEFIPDAKTITEYASSRKLDVRQRSALFVQVCDAVQHGHQKGIIHRDLKPANILVGGSGRPKVIDFGIARTLERDGASATIQTAPGQLIGTFQYMSPEQLDGDSNALDTRCDVYSLGVVLFELLCGQLPYDLTKSSAYEAIRVLKEQSPARPSVIRPSFKGDVETIITKAMEKDPHLRYQSVADFASDIRRYLVGEPIEARRGSRFYVFRRTLYRYRRSLAVAAVAFIGLIVFGISASVLWQSAEHQRQQAELARHESNILLGRSLIRQDDPINASAILWREFLKRDTTRTRLAMFELYNRYPLLWENAGFGPQMDVEYSPSGRWLATVGRDGRLTFYASDKGTVTQVVGSQTARARCVVFSPAAPGVIYVGGADGKLRVFPFQEESGTVVETPIDTIDVSDITVSCVAVSNDGAWLAAGCMQEADSESGITPVRSIVRLWRLKPFAEHHSFTIEHEGVVDLEFSPDNAALACGTIAGSRGRERRTSGRARIWDLPSGFLMHESDGTVGAHCRSIRFSADGTQLYCGVEQVFEWDLVENRHVQLEIVAAHGVRAVAVPPRPDLPFVAFACGDGNIRFVDLRAKTLLPTRGFHNSAVSANVDICFAPDSRTVASVAGDGIRVWRFPPATDLRFPTPGHTEEQSIVAIGLSGSRDPCLVATARILSNQKQPSDSVNVLDKGCRTALWPAASTEDFVVLPVVTETALVAVSVNGCRMASLDQPKGSAFRVVARTTSDPEEQLLALDLEKQPSVLHWLDDQGSTVLIGFKDGTVAARHVDAQQSAARSSLEIIHKFDTCCERFAVSSDRNWLAVCSEGDGANQKGHVRLWRVTGLPPAEHAFADAYEFVNEFEAHNSVWSVALVRDAADRLIAATTGGVRDVFLWDALTGERIAKLAGHKDRIRCCHALGDHLLVTSSDDNTARIWDVCEQEELCQLYEGGSSCPITTVCDSRIAIADKDTIRIIDYNEIQSIIDRERARRAHGSERGN